MKKTLTYVLAKLFYLYQAQQALNQRDLGSPPYPYHWVKETLVPDPQREENFKRGLEIMVEDHLLPGTKFDFQESTVNRLVLETQTFIMTVEASLIHTYHVTTTALADYILMDHEVSRFRLALWKEVEA